MLLSFCHPFRNGQMRRQSKLFEFDRLMYPIKDGAQVTSGCKGRLVSPVPTNHCSKRIKVYTISDTIRLSLDPNFLCARTILTSLVQQTHGQLLRTPPLHQKSLV